MFFAMIIAALCLNIYEWSRIKYDDSNEFVNRNLQLFGFIIASVAAVSTWYLLVLRR